MMNGDVNSKKILVVTTRASTVGTERPKSALPAPEEVLLIKQKSSFYKEDTNGVNWNNDSLV